jgi:hypothetical protein
LSFVFGFALGAAPRAGALPLVVGALALAEGAGALAVASRDGRRELALDDGVAVAEGAGGGAAEGTSLAVDALELDAAGAMLVGAVEVGCSAPTSDRMRAHGIRSRIA